jgi:hypothetical protein
MRGPSRLWPDYSMPIVVGMAVLSATNFLVNWVFISWPHQLPVYLTSSLVALWFVQRAVRNGTVTARDIGLAPGGWKPQHRIYGVAMVLLMGYGGFATLQVARTPDFADYCFWFVFLLPASLAELLVFISIGYCLPDNWLKRRGASPLVAALGAAAFSGVTFGFYHYTHDPLWWEFALYPLIPVMWLNLLYFIPTRNFQLTLLLHNAFAAVGFTGVQYRDKEPNPLLEPTEYKTPLLLTMTIVAFALPYLILHALEWRVWSGRGQEPTWQEPARGEQGALTETP